MPQCPAALQMIWDFRALILPPSNRHGSWKAPDLPFLRYAELPPEMLAVLPDELFARIPPVLCMDVSTADIPVYPATGSEGVHGG